MDDVPPTTISELEDQGFVEVEETFGGNRYIRLTPEGWLKALILSHEIDSSEQQSRRTVLLKYFKSKVADRSGAELVDVREVAQDAGLPTGWVYNAVAAQLLAQCHPDKNYRVTLTPELDIVLPPTFGQTPVDL